MVPFKIKLVLPSPQTAVVHFDWRIPVTCGPIVMISQTVKCGHAVINIIGKSQTQVVTLCWDSREHDNISVADSHTDPSIFQRIHHSSLI